MALRDEIQKAKTEVVADGYEMSVGEIINLYRDREIVVNPAFQRLFRWDDDRKSRFIESLLLGIPIPPIFVYQDSGGIWELIDGLQRLSTILEFVGVLRRADDSLYDASSLEGTKFLPSLAGKRWSGPEEESAVAIGADLQLLIKRARIRVEILKNESDPKAKFELFQRLNTGGASLSPQEVRNCVAVMINEPFYEWLSLCATSRNFRETIDQTDQAIQMQAELELALRFFAFRKIPYQTGLNVHEYLDEALVLMASDATFDRMKEQQVFEATFAALCEAMGNKCFKKWNGEDFSGKFLMSVFEVVATGVSENIDAILALGESKTGFLRTRCVDLWSNDVFISNNGAGVRGTTRLTHLLPMAKDYFSVNEN